MSEDIINHPSHYEECGNGGYEPIDLIELYPFCLGTAMKYLFRAGKKAGNSYEQDLKKARWYLRRALQTGMTELRMAWPKRDCAKVLVALVANGKNVNPLLADLFTRNERYAPIVMEESIRRVIEKINEIVGDAP